LHIEKYQVIHETHSYNRRQSAKDNYLIPLRHLKQDQHNIMELGPKIWNSLPLTILKKLSNFKNFTMIMCYKIMLSFVFSQVLTFALKRSWTRTKIFYTCVEVLLKWAMTIV